LALSISVSCTKDDDIYKVVSNKAEITSFEINDVQATITDTDIAITLPHGTNLTNLSAKVTISENATISPNPETSADYSSPKEFNVTAEDGATKKTYKVTVTIAAVVPSGENPFAEGAFVLRLVQDQLRELDFRHASGTTTTKVFQKANNGWKIDGFSITDIIPHKEGYLIFSNFDDQSSSKLFFTDLKLKIKKEVAIEKTNVNAHRYAQIGNKVYYTNISTNVEVNASKNKVYIVDVEAQTLKKLNKKIKQFFVSSTQELYYTDFVNGFYKVTDLNNLTTTKIEDFDDYATSILLDANDKLWVTHASKPLSGIIDIINKIRGLFDYKIVMTCYDIKANKKYTGISTEDFNRDSYLTLNEKDNSVLMITNQNTHLNNPKKELQKLYIDGDKVKIAPILELPKSNTLTSDVDLFNTAPDKLLVVGRESETYYYDIDLNTNGISDKTFGIQGLFFRKAIP
jgi:hypothetical protein